MKDGGSPLCFFCGGPATHLCNCGHWLCSRPLCLLRGAKLYAQQTSQGLFYRVKGERGLRRL